MPNSDRKAQRKTPPVESMEPDVPCPGDKSEEAPPSMGDNSLPMIEQRLRAHAAKLTQHDAGRREEYLGIGAELAAAKQSLNGDTKKLNKWIVDRGIDKLRGLRESACRSNAMWCFENKELLVNIKGAHPNRIRDNYRKKHPEDDAGEPMESSTEGAITDTAQTGAEISEHTAGIAEPSAEIVEEATGETPEPTEVITSPPIGQEKPPGLDAAVDVPPASVESTALVPTPSIEKKARRRPHTIKPLAHSGESETETPEEALRTALLQVIAKPEFAAVEASFREQLRKAIKRVASL